MPYNKLLINLDHLVFTVKYQTLLISKVINYTLIVYRGGLRGALWASARGPALSGGPADFLGLAVVCGAMFFGTAPHGFGRTYYICIGESPRTPL